MVHFGTEEILSLHKLTLNFEKFSWRPLSKAPSLQFCYEEDIIIRDFYQLIRN